MIVGQTGSGKTVTWKMLKKTLTRLHKERKGSGYQIVRVRRRIYIVHTRTYSYVHTHIHVHV